MLMDKSYLITVVLPVYNGEKYISQAIESILNQSYTNWELIIVDDASTDQTPILINSYAQLDDRIIIITNQVNCKLPKSLNIGHEKAKGELITWTSDDNWYVPDAFQNFLEVFQNKSIDIVYSDFNLVNYRSETIRYRSLSEPENLINENCIGASFMYRRKVFESLGGYQEDLFLVEDYDFWLRAFLKFNFRYIPQAWYNYRSHAESLTNSIANNQSKKQIWLTNLELMYGRFFSNLSIQSNFLTELFVSDLSHLPYDISKVPKNGKDLDLLIIELKKNSHLQSIKIQQVLANKLIYLMVHNFESKKAFVYNFFILRFFGAILTKNQWKILIKYSFIK